MAAVHRKTGRGRETGFKLHVAKFNIIKLILETIEGHFISKCHTSNIHCI